jgi:hypothetical protein
MIIKSCANKSGNFPRKEGPNLMLIRRCSWRSVQLHQLWRPREIHTREAIYDKRWPGWEVVVGIEVHAQIKSHRKLFSGAPMSDSMTMSELIQHEQSPSHLVRASYLIPLCPHSMLRFPERYL